MNCPVCEVELKIADRQGIEIDYCPKCRGVWLDRGELDKIIERAAGAIEGERDYRLRGGYNRNPGKSSHCDHYKSYKHKKRRSILSELLDF